VDDLEDLVTDGSPTARELAERQKMLVEPARYCSPRRQTHFEPWFLELNDIL
jgi:hypothetical protein